jgi:dihydroorotate dehydrogenase electron transfer subunit
LSAYHIAYNRLRVTHIQNTENKSRTVKTFTFRDKHCSRARPGQFLMLWVPGVDEIPLSISDAHEDGTVTVAVRNVGSATGALHDMKAGLLIGVRGPFGNWFSVRKGRLLIVGGGTGVAPLLFLAKELIVKEANVTFVLGAKTEEELLFINELERVCSSLNVMATTEDGSRGLKCLATDPLGTITAREKPDLIYACGPEQMIRKTFDLAEERNVRMEASLERLMRCAIGLCGSCIIGKYRVCRDGPVFSTEKLREVRPELGVSKRDFDSSRIPL